MYRGLDSSAGSNAGVPRFPQAAMLELEFAQVSDHGKVREHNEDYLGHVLPVSPEQARTHGWLFALADGVGGQDQGEVASQVAVETLLQGFCSAPHGEALGDLLPRLVQTANTKVYEAGRAAAPGGVAMATTLVACALRFDRAVVAHVGDSRAYLVRRGHARQLTRDHTVAGEQVRIGVLSAREASEAPTRHFLSRSLGNDLFVSADVTETLVLPGDFILLCSDGLHGAVDSNDISRVIASTADLQTASQELVAIANERDGSDNVSIQLIRIRGVERVGMYRGRPYKLR
jgi:serine/threonine protein phosphatase PrpC